MCGGRQCTSFRRRCPARRERLFILVTPPDADATEWGQRNQNIWERRIGPQNQNALAETRCCSDAAANAARDGRDDRVAQRGSSGI